MLNYSWKASQNRWGRPELNATFSIGFGNCLIIRTMIIFLIIFLIMFSSDYYFFDYVTIISIIFPIIFDYVRGSHPNLQKLADANSRPMLPVR